MEQGTHTLRSSVHAFSPWVGAAFECPLPMEFFARFLVRTRIVRTVVADASISADVDAFEHAAKFTAALLLRNF